PDSIFNRDFFYATPNHLEEFVPVENPRILNSLRLIAVKDYRPNHHMDLMMDANKSRAVAFLVEEEIQKEDEIINNSSPAQLE
ncbi:MAG: hypothetical protein HYZ21_15040, partial [Chloroflexi bacterium]|nr:hypothetical protein [Chloroflexota bacterium]